MGGMKIPKSFQVHHGRNPEKELRNLQHQFRAASRRHDGISAPRLAHKRVKIWPLTILGAIALYLVLANFLPWLPSMALESGPYYRNCDAARAAGVAPIYRGQPGYRLPLDRDGDGIACEPRPH